MTRESKWYMAATDSSPTSRTHQGDESSFERRSLDGGLGDIDTRIHHYNIVEVVELTERALVGYEVDSRHCGYPKIAEGFGPH